MIACVIIVSARGSLKQLPWNGRFGRTSTNTIVRKRDMAIRRFKQNDNNLAWSYYRYSSDAQSDASIAQQREAVEKFAAENGWMICREYKDEAISGTDSERREFRALLHDVGIAKPAALIVWKLDRLSRDFYDLFDAFRIIEDAGCAVYSVTEAHLRGNSDKLLKALTAYQAEMYVSNLSDNIRRGQADVAKNGLYAGYRVLGYKAVPALDAASHRQRYAIDETTAPVVVRIFSEYVNGERPTDIIRRLNEEGFRSVRGKEFCINSFRKIIHNRMYIGEYRYKDVVIPNGVPRIVTDEMFQKAQERMKRNQRDSSLHVHREPDAPRFWLTGKLYCGMCGSSMQGVSGTSKTRGKKHYYYSCRLQRRHQCNKKPVRKEIIEARVTELLSLLLSDSEVVASLAVDIAADIRAHQTDNADRIASLKREKEKTEKEINNLVSALKAGIWSSTTAEELTRLETKKTNLEALVRAEESLKALADDEASIKRFFSRYYGSDLTDTAVRDYLLENLVDKIYLYDDNRIVITIRYSETHREEVEWSLVDDAVDDVFSDEQGFDASDHMLHQTEKGTQRVSFFV